MTAPQSPAQTIPWWRSRTILWGLLGVLLAAGDALLTWAEGGELSWRTAVIAVGGAVAVWLRRNATALIGAAVTGEPPAAPPAGPTAPEGPKS